MSSILKALKKIESQKVETKLPAWPYRIDNRESMNRYSKRSWRHQKLLTILIAICALALAGKLYFGGRHPSENTPSGSGFSVKAAAPGVSLTGETSPHRVQAPSSGNTVPPVQTVSRENPGRTVPEPVPIETVTKPPVDTPSTAPANNAGLTLQALAWSNQPEERFVVINENIIHEGGTVNGSVVAKIEPDFVTIRTDGTSWQLRQGQEH